MTLYTILNRHFGGESIYAVNGLEIDSSRQRLQALPDAERRTIRYLYGHMAFGWHRYLDTHARYFTFMRHPVSRIVSHYNYVLHRAPKGHYLHDAVVRSGMSLTDYVTSGVSDELNNGQVRLLAGIEDPLQVPFGRSKLPYGTNDSALLDQALANIENWFFMVGLQERFDESVILLSDALGIADLTHTRTNAKRESPSLVSEADRDVILAYNQLDFQLHEIMRQRLEIAIDRCPNIQRSLRILRARNALAATVNAQKTRIPGPIRSRLGKVRRARLNSRSDS